MSRFDRLRKEYQDHGLSESELAADPIAQFQRWFDDAVARGDADWLEPNAMSLATCDRSGNVTCRTVLLKHFDQNGFTFFTNYDSEKSQQIVANPRVSLLFHWAYLGRQVRIDGTATRTSRAISETYFRSRPRGAQIGASISRQSSVAMNRDAMDEQFAIFQREFEDRPIPLPEHWGGYIVSPHRLEFWQGRADRLHDRFRYRRLDTGRWTLERLYP
jgi:pyridoxamine 5'-phosphate oxidase